MAVYKPSKAVFSRDPNNNSMTLVFHVRPGNGAGQPVNPLRPDEVEIDAERDGPINLIDLVRKKNDYSEFDKKWSFPQKLISIVSDTETADDRVANLSELYDNTALVHGRLIANAQYFVRLAFCVFYEASDKMRRPLGKKRSAK